MLTVDRLLEDLLLSDSGSELSWNLLCIWAEFFCWAGEYPHQIWRKQLTLILGRSFQSDSSGNDALWKSSWRGAGAVGKFGQTISFASFRVPSSWHASPTGFIISLKQVISFALVSRVSSDISLLDPSGAFRIPFKRMSAIPTMHSAMPYYVQ